MVGFGDEFRRRRCRWEAGPEIEIRGTVTNLSTVFFRLTAELEASYTPTAHSEEDSHRSLSDRPRLNAAQAHLSNTKIGRAVAVCGGSSARVARSIRFDSQGSRSAHARVRIQQDLRL